MAFLSSIDVVGSGLTAQQLRLDVVAENITNSTTTRTENGGTYRRKVVAFEEIPQREGFREVMARTAGLEANASRQTGGGVRVAGILEDPSDFKLVFDPTHPDANEEGYVELPNVDMVKEMADAIAANQAYAANVTAFNTLKAVIAKGLEIGR